MSNPDVPGLEACKRLNWPCEPGRTGWWWTYVSPEDPFSLRFGKQRAPCPGEEDYPAPTIGEMVDYTKHHKWGLAVDATAPHLGTAVQIFVGEKEYGADEDELKDALANVLAEAVEKAPEEKH